MEKGRVDWPSFLACVSIVLVKQLSADHGRAEPWAHSQAHLPSQQ